MTRYIPKTFTVPFVLASTLGLMSLPLHAQEEAPHPGGMPPPQQQQNNFSNENIEQFAEASKEVEELGNTYSTKIEQASSQDEASNLQQEANEKMVQAVQEAGLTIVTYNAIARAASQDPSLQRKIQNAQTN